MIVYKEFPPKLSVISINDVSYFTIFKGRKNKYLFSVNGRNLWFIIPGSRVL